ncbi:MAG: tRNA pseudouridine(55) synthase TruB [Ruminococcus sp.]|nr:tRNA pseudouridine(55) synthase TruB [Ruminococcus sp.]
MTDRSTLCGVLPVYKPKDWTSFDVVAKLRGILKMKKLGHAGTLDPMAEGVLPVLVGRAAKACDILPDTAKGYEAGFKLGLTTDTQDITGTVISSREAKVGIAELTAAAESFAGDIMQLPPMYSAVKVGGKRLYELAREGKEIDRQPRPRRVEFIEILSYDEQSAEGTLAAEVSRGTYIRTLINDIGERVGCGAVMTSLKRIKACGFLAEDCFTLEEIAAAAAEDRVRELIAPVEDLFEDLPDVTLSAHFERLYKNGVKLRPEQIGAPEGPFRVFGESGGFIGIAQVNEKNEVRSVRNFHGE